MKSQCTVGHTITYLLRAPNFIYIYINIYIIESEVFCVTLGGVFGKLGYTCVYGK